MRTRHRKSTGTAVRGALPAGPKLPSETSSEFRPQFMDRAICKMQRVALPPLFKRFQMGG